MFPGKNYSVFGFMIKFKRHTKPYIYGYYLTSMSVVIIAGCSFIVPPKAIPGRLALLVTYFWFKWKWLKVEVSQRRLQSEASVKFLPKNQISQKIYLLFHFANWHLCRT